MPYENEHSCRLKSPTKYDKFARKNCEQKHDGKCIDVIYGIKSGKSEIQALRYPKGSWSAQAARNHCSGRGGSFEAAKKSVKRKTMSASLMIPEHPQIVQELTGNETPIQLRDIPRESYTAIAVIGDQFWSEGKTGMGGKPEFASAKALKRDHKTMDGTFHNLDHARTIDSLVGVHENTEYDNRNKRMIIHIYPDEKFGSYGKWKSFIEACKRQNYTPNVSIEAFVECEDMPASELPEGIDYGKFGIKDDDIVEVETGYRFLGAATVWRGACSSDDGCGIIVENDVNTATATVEYNYIALNENGQIKETKKMTDKPEDEPKEIKPPEEEPPKEEPPKEEEKPKDESEEEKTENAKNIKAFQEKLTACGEIRAQLEQKNTELEKKVKELEDKLSKPVTRSQPTTNNDADTKTRVANAIEKYIK